jgi:AbiV family abortive infection protein
MKTTKGFMQLSPEECEAVSKAVMDNAYTHRRIANFLADTKEHSNAIAHLILATEEYIKGLVLFLDSKGFEFRKVEGVQKLFYMHVPRHNLLKEIFTVWLLMKPYIGRQIQRDGKPTRKDRISKILDGTINIAQLFLGGATGFVNYRWWEQADKLKQRGFYVDYQEELISPNQIGSEDWITASKNVEVIFEDIDKFMNHIGNLNNHELKSLHKNFDDSQIKDMVAETIRRKK